MEIWLWIGFLAFVGGMLWVDLGVINREAHVIRIRDAMLWTSVCAVLAVAFSGAVYYVYEHQLLGFGATSRAAGGAVSGAQAAMQFLTGWIIEQSLSLDNVFVIALIFEYFKIPLLHQHRVLFWGIIGALVMRGVMIAAGAALLQTFAWTMYAFGGLLVFTAVKMMFAGEGDVEPERNPLVRAARRVYPVTTELHGQKFVVRLAGRMTLTPLFLVLLVVESTDVLFAVDSIPAIFAITQDPFLVFTSNIFAILCLRSMYFALAGMMDMFRYLKYSLVFVLAFVGVKMILATAERDRLPFGHHVPIELSLLLIAAALVLGVGASLVTGRRERREKRSSHGGA